MILENKKFGIIYFKILDLLISFIAWNFFTYFAIGIFGVIVLLVIQTPLEKPILMLIEATMFRNGNSREVFTLDNSNIPGIVMTWSMEISLIIAASEFVLGKRFNQNNKLKITIITIFALNLAGYLKMLTVGIPSMLFFVLIFCFTTAGYFVFTKLNSLREKLTDYSNMK